MTQRAKPRQELSEFDQLVRSRINRVAKSVVTSPSDPNGGAKLPKRQKDAPERKAKGKTQYMAVFDREAQQSDDQLEDWEDDTNNTTESPERFVNDDDDAPEDYDDQDWEDNRRSDDDGDGVYDPYGDDDEMDDASIEALDLPDDDDKEQYIKVRGHKRRKIAKSAKGDMDEEFEELSDDDDDLDEGDDDDDDEDKPKSKPKRRTKEEDEKMEKSQRRRQTVRKALGSDAMRIVDGNEFIKSLTDAVFDLAEDQRMEVRTARSEIRRLQKQVAALGKMVQAENREMTKSLINGQLQLAGFGQDVQAATPVGQPMRKGYGAPIATSQRALPNEFDLAKAMDVLDEAFIAGADNIQKDITILENDGVRSVHLLSSDAQQVLRKNKLL